MKNETRVHVYHTTDLITFLVILLGLLMLIACAGSTVKDVFDHVIDRLEAFR